MGLVEVLEDDGDVHVDDDHEVDDDEGHEVDHGHEGVPAVPVRQPLVVSRVMIHSTLEIDLGDHVPCSSGRTREASPAAAPARRSSPRTSPA